MKETEEKEWRVHPYYKSELAQAYALYLSTGAALKRLAYWIRLNEPLTAALKETGYRNTQHTFTSKQVELIFEYLGPP